MSNLVHNEQVKLVSAFTANLAVASITAGFLVPWIGFFTKQGSLVDIDFIHFVGSVVLGGGFGTFLAWMAKRSLLFLKE